MVKVVPFALTVVTLGLLSGSTVRAGDYYYGCWCRCPNVAAPTVAPVPAAPPSAAYIPPSPAPPVGRVAAAPANRYRAWSVEPLGDDRVSVSPTLAPLGEPAIVRSPYFAFPRTRHFDRTIDRPPKTIKPLL